MKTFFSGAIPRVIANIRGLKNGLGQQVATPENDPYFFGKQFFMPNPDPILRNMGKADMVYASILADSHVMGEVRSIRGSFRDFEWRINVGADNDAKAAAARNLCHEWMQQHTPNAAADWLEVMWQMMSAILTGKRVHELVWEYVGGTYLPTQVLDRPGRRFMFDADSKLLLQTQASPLGESTDDFKFVLSRHMASVENPYGIALLSSCFWPWTFKTGGWRYFVKYCERHGLPWPVARYPIGTSETDQNALADALQDMLESAYAVVPDGTGVELLTPTASGSTLPQMSLIHECNKEISKALTGQALVAELHSVGARAATETAMKRQEGINDADRDIAVNSFGQIFKWITLFNFGEGVAAPTLEFFKQTAAGKERAEAYQIAAQMGAKPSKRAMLEELNIPQAEDEVDALLPSAQAPRIVNEAAPTDNLNARADFASAAKIGMRFAREAGMSEDAAIALASQGAQQMIEGSIIAPVYKLLAQFEAEGKTLAQFEDALVDVVGNMDTSALRELTEQALQFAMLKGIVDAQAAQTNTRQASGAAQ